LKKYASQPNQDPSNDKFEYNHNSFNKNSFTLSSEYLINSGGDNSLINS
jgi:hypothetical protein